MSIRQKLDTVFAWPFGADEDSTDSGFSGDIDDQFSDIVDHLEEHGGRLDDRHGEIKVGSISPSTRCTTRRRSITIETITMNNS